MGPSPGSSGELAGHRHCPRQVFIDLGTHRPLGFATLPLGFLNICIHYYRKHRVEGIAFSLSDSTQADVLCVHTRTCALGDYLLKNMYVYRVLLLTLHG